MVLFIHSNNFLQVGKLHNFRKKLLLTLGDALRFGTNGKDQNSQSAKIEWFLPLAKLGGVWLPLLNFSRCPIECMDTCMEY